MLIRDDNFAHVSFTEGDNQHFTVSKVIFNDLRGTSYENTNQTLDNYFNMFPREMGVAIDLYDNGMLLDIDKFDAFIGEPLIGATTKSSTKKKTSKPRSPTSLRPNRPNSSNNKNRWSSWPTGSTVSPPLPRRKVSCTGYSNRECNPTIK